MHDQGTLGVADEGKYLIGAGVRGIGQAVGDILGADGDAVLEVTARGVLQVIE